MPKGFWIACVNVKNQNEFKKLLDEAHKGTDNTNKD